MKAINNINKSAASLRMIEWKTLNWSQINKYVKRLRQRIFRAEQLGQHKQFKKFKYTNCLREMMA